MTRAARAARAAARTGRAAGIARAAAVAAACVLSAASCGSARPGGTSAPPAPGPSLATSVATAAGTWAVMVLGGSAAAHHGFWQLLTRPAGTRAWRLVTPPGVASNGGLAVAPAGGRSAEAGFLPSQGRSFSPLAATADGGSRWSPGVLGAGLARLPGALAAAPGTGRLLALLAGGTAELWARLATLGSLARTAAGRRCGLTGLAAASFGPSNAPVLAGTCTHRATAGVFTLSGGTWHLAGPALPASLGAPVRILAVTPAGGAATAVLAAGTGRNVMLLAAWRHGARWALSPPLPLGGAQVRSVSAGPGGATGIMLNGRAAVTVAGPGASWQWLPFLPPGSQTLAFGPGARVAALAAAGSTFTGWTWAPGSAAWAKVQTLHVPIQYGSSA